MERRTITAALVAMLLASTAHAEVITVAQEGQRKLEPGAGPFVSGSRSRFFIGEDVGGNVPDGWVTSLVIEADTTTNMGRVTEATWSYPELTRTVSNTFDYERTVPQPWPNPSIIETGTITETLTYTWSSVAGSFAATDWAPMQNPFQPRFPFPLVSETPPQFSLTGTYSVVGSRDSFTRDFSYSIAQTPVVTLAVIDPWYRRDGSIYFTEAEAVETSFRLVPSQSTITANVDGFDFTARLNNIRVPVTVPEPSGLFLAVLAGLGLLRRR